MTHYRFVWSVDVVDPRTVLGSKVSLHVCQTTYMQRSESAVEVRLVPSLYWQDVADC